MNRPVFVHRYDLPLNEVINYKSLQVLRIEVKRALLAIHSIVDMLLFVIWIW